MIVFLTVKGIKAWGFVLNLGPLHMSHKIQGPSHSSEVFLEQIMTLLIEHHSQYV